MTANPVYEFTEREQHILKLLVDHYIEQGTPVGSRTLSRLPGIDISAASVRNVMGDLEHMGLLKSPHTSSGRVPTSAAFRVFVDKLLDVKPPEKGTIEHIRTLLDPSLNDQALVKIASNYLSNFTRMAGMVTVPRREEKPLQQVEFLPLSDQRVLVILIISDDDVQNRIIHVQRNYSKDELAEFARELNEVYLGRPLAEVRDRMRKDLERTREDMGNSMQRMIDVAGQVFGPDEAEDNEDSMLMAGESNLLGHADLGDVSKLRDLFNAFQQKRDIFHLLERCVSADGVQIFIGRESGYDALGECSVVTAPYEINGKLLGVLGVVGPKRMSYAQVIPVVDVTSKLLSAALNMRN
ncbi:heat-inducible transcriptional repressor HrcA [Granulosicoccus antarcticus]|uniref:Heat-inducible transcription repressor HrcA n=1 Tax=Granulosicoccus antarcticus IMCC3135 TaxID=1192854 RepID=A0A2Z2NU48_9GAMM|nr:heat-inducible transcriptional repressor HrcA [Granulosicoccus antarcticus]ASJ75092.1 Heat-inducible transcription repressor HrcA [Granulosicoccus antarcticus IMCC3135]